MVIIAGREIKNFSEPFIIAEVGSNHKGDLALAKHLIDKAAQCGADSVKFQVWSKKSLFSKVVFANRPELEEQIERYSLSLPDFKELKEYGDARGIMISASAFCKEEVDFLVREVNVAYLKVASMDVTHLPFLEYVAQQGKPIVMSTGLASIAEIDEAVTVIHRYNRNLILLHCTSLYPQQDEQSHLNNLPFLQETFNVPVGYSDHSLGITIPLGAVVKGACLLEKHFALNNQDEKIWDQNFSASPEELKNLVVESKRLVRALGNIRITLDAAKLKQREVMRRSIVTSRHLPQGHILTIEDLLFKRPGTGLEPKQVAIVIGKQLKRDLAPDTLLTWADLL